MFSSKYLALVALSALTLTGCSSDLTPSAEITPAPMTACIVVDSSGLNDGGSNESAYYALKQAVVSKGLAKAQKVLKEDAKPGSIAATLNAFAQNGCGVVVGVGEKLTSPMLRAAGKNSETKFVLVDDSTATLTVLPTNLVHLTYDARQGGVLAGYLAAAASKTGIVATFGSGRTSNVFAAIEGFRKGVARFNLDNNAAVVVLGASSSTQNSWKIIGTQSNVARARNLTNRFFAQGADVVFPVAGKAGLGAGQATLEHPGTLVIGGSRDWYLSANAASFKRNIIASVQKQVSSRVYEQIVAVLSGKFVAGDFQGSLKDEGVTLTLENEVPYPTEFKGAYAALVAELSSGKL